ncbi:MAG: ribosome biogenesis GTPase Der [Spirochaetales bacterium]|nr:ribosome biogenesis GTPase Der [Spirochaetales bacterium]
MISIPVKVDFPRIAIIGRPNVGKSTLFNRLLGTKRAITDPTPGVTRDSVESSCEFEGKSFILIDTGGFTLQEGEYNQLVSGKSLAVAGEADLVILLIDITDINGDDLEFIEKVRPLEEKIILVVNKVDNEKRAQQIWNLYKFGFKRMVDVSAVHGRNIDKLIQEILFFFKDHETRKTETGGRQKIRLAILGKPNTGKSTMTNYLIGEEKSIVSSIPGTTRDVVEGSFLYNNYHFQVLDTAGIRRKKKVKESVEYYSVNRAIRAIEDSDVVFLLIESRCNITEQDKKIAALIEKKGRGIVLVLNKWDLLEHIPNRLQAVTDRLRFLFPMLHFAPIVPVSSMTGEGMKKLLSTSIKVYRQLASRIDTSRLNTLLKRWTDLDSVKVRGKEVKIRYATQVSSNPVKFVFFLSRCGELRNEQKLYMKNRLRRELKLDSIPVELEFREKEKNSRRH